MSNPNNDNRESEVDLEKEFEDLGNENAAEEEDETPESEKENKEEEEEEGEEDKDENKGEDEDEDDKALNDPKFKGKTPKELIKMYNNLEGMIGTKAMKMAQAFLTKNNKDIDIKKEDKGKEDDFDLGLSDEQIAAMKPKEFARILNQKITERATEIARNAIQRSEEVKTNVRRELNQAVEIYPHLKTNQAYRGIVLDIIEAGNAKGKTISLKDACKKADEALGIKKEDKPEEKKKIIKTAVEKPEGEDGKPVLSDEDRVKQGIMKGGRSGGFNPMGGLGI